MAKIKINIVPKQEVEVVTGFECDVCHKRFHLDNISEFQVCEFIHIKKYFGYASIFGDGDSIELDICQGCFKKILEQFIPNYQQLINDKPISADK